MAGKDLRRKLGMMLASVKSIPSTSNYIQNGLVLMLDGIEKGNVSKKWIDIVNGHVFNQEGLSNARFNEDNIEITDATSFVVSAFLTPTSDIGTIEVVFEKTNTSGAIIASRSDVDRMCFVVLNSRLYISHKSNNKTYPVQNGSVSVSEDLCLVNGVGVESNGSGYINVYSDTMTRVGRRNSSSSDKYYFNGKIYSIRIYNRKLSQNEILHNYAIDRRRFPFLQNT